MGTWGTGLYQNDLSADVRDDYISKLKSGKSDEEVLHEVLSEYREESEDTDCKYDFYLALADTLWKKGRLTEEIRDRALRMIEEDKESERWQTERIRKERCRVLEKLKVKLEGEMPERKRIPVHKPHILGWEVGDVYFFRINERIKGFEKFFGWYALFYVDRIYPKDWYGRGIEDEIAEAYFFLREDKPESMEDFYTSKIICFLMGEAGYRYRAEICERSERERPKGLTLLGKCKEFNYPNNENTDNTPFSWSSVNLRNMLWGYGNQLKVEATDLKNSDDKL